MLFKAFVKPWRRLPFCCRVRPKTPSCAQPTEMTGTTELIWVWLHKKNFIRKAKSVVSIFTLHFVFLFFLAIHKARRQFDPALLHTKGDKTIYLLPTISKADRKYRVKKYYRVENFKVQFLLKRTRTPWTSSYSLRHSRALLREQFFSTRSLCRKLIYRVTVL